MDISDLNVEEHMLKGHTNHSRACAFTNENLDDLMKKIDHKDKNILGITASGDHMIMSFGDGCS